MIIPFRMSLFCQSWLPLPGRQAGRAMASGLILSALAAVPASAVAATAPETANSPEGLWLNQKNSVAVRVALCGTGLCGHIAWLKKPYHKDGTLKRDQGRPWCGLAILRGFHQDGDATWSGGTIYDPDSGNTYHSTLSVDGDTLKVRGYVLIPLFGRTLQWHRIKAPPGPCPTNKQGALTGATDKP